ncbi:MFS transporter [Rhizobium sp. KVB221]|uniref:MFS transporter n=1 Tax=Rhizobium setariae TaxID=2801340 RepID=A0A936YRC9_9HYPH|nr:MFS transporter [Rhizobium setariae]MBL0370935.1 MFS transporter [Rhizobium setariae]
MLSAFLIVLRNPPIRVATIALFISGMTGGATLPYLSIVGVRQFHLSDQALSLLLFMIALANLIYGVTVAVFSDLIADRKPLLLGVLLAGIVGFGAIYLVPDIRVFALCAVLLVPLSNSSYSLGFATIRSLSNRLAASEARAITSVVRAVFSGSWILVPGLVGFWLANTETMLGAWGFSAVACLAGFLVILTMMPPMRSAPKQQAGGPSFFASLRLATTPIMLTRVTSMSLITAATRLIAIIQPLIMTGIAGGTLMDVGIVAGLCAALEIPFMLIWGRLLKRLTVVQALAIGALIYAGFMAALSFATQPWHIYLLLVPNAFGIAAILSLPLSYFQDLWLDKPGLGTSLNQMTSFLSNGLSAAAFAIGALALGYSSTAWLGVAMALAGVAGLLILEKRQAATA